MRSDTTIMENSWSCPSCGNFEDNHETLTLTGQEDIVCSKCGLVFDPHARLCSEETLLEFIILAIDHGLTVRQVRDKYGDPHLVICHAPEAIGCGLGQESECPICRQNTSGTLPLHGMYPCRRHSEIILARLEDNKAFQTAMEQVLNKVKKKA